MNYKITLKILDIVLALILIFNSAVSLWTHNLFAFATNLIAQLLLLRIKIMEW